MVQQEVLQHKTKSFQSVLENIVIFTTVISYVVIAFYNPLNNQNGSSNKYFFQTNKDLFDEQSNFESVENSARFTDQSGVSNLVGSDYFYLCVSLLITLVIIHMIYVFHICNHKITTLNEEKENILNKLKDIHVSILSEQQELEKAKMEINLLKEEKEHLLKKFTMEKHANFMLKQDKVKLSRKIKDLDTHMRRLKIRGNNQIRSGRKELKIMQKGEENMESQLTELKNMIFFEQYKIMNDAIKTVKEENYNLVEKIKERESQLVALRTMITGQRSPSISDEEDYRLEIMEYDSDSSDSLFCENLLISFLDIDESAC